MYTKVQLYVEDLLFATATAINKKEAKNQVCIKAFRILSTLTSQEIADQVMVIHFQALLSVSSNLLCLKD